jgi:PAS domain S-box-containing protein
MGRLAFNTVERPSPGLLSGGLFFDTRISSCPENRAAARLSYRPLNFLSFASWLSHSRAVRCAVGALVALVIITAGAADVPKKVLIVHSFGSAAPPFTTHSITFETELTERIGERVDLDEVSLDHARYADPDMEEALVEYLQKRQAKWQPDLVVPIGSPAGIFVERYRERLFPRTPILYASMDRRRLAAGALNNNAAFVGESFDGPGFIEDILQLAPDTTNIVCVIGASQVERYWTAAFQSEFARFTNRVSFTWLNELSFEQMLDKVAHLPPRSFIFLILLIRDATGVTHNADEALRRISKVANAPVNGIYEEQLGLGIVGGRLYRAEFEGVEGARVAIRILHGEPATNFPPEFIGPIGTQYDWRQLRRWNIREDRLPRGSVIKFREPTNWDRYGNWIIGVISLLVIQGVLIGALVANLGKRRKAERSLRGSEERMKLAASAAEMCLWELDCASDRVWVAGPLAERIGMHQENTHFADVIQGIHPDDQDRVATALKKSREGKGDFESIHRRLLPDGKIMWLAARGRTEFNHARKPLRMRGVSMDITARKEAEERARESEGKFLVMANSAPVIMWATGLDKLCTFCNQTWLDFTGRPLEQQLGTGWAESLHPEDRAGCVKTYSEAFDARQPFTQEYRVRRHDGQYRWISDHGVPRYDAQHNFLGFIGSGVDITEQKRAEDDALRMREELAHVSRVSTLVELGGALAHELNQPLTAILSNAQAAVRFLDAGPAKVGELREILKDIADEDRRAGEVIVRMRAMLRKENARMASEDLNEIVHEVLGMLRSELLIRKMTSVTHLAPKLPQVIGDRVRLQQVFMNLIVNACDAMADELPPDRKVTIETKDTSDGFVRVSVSDHGSGFPVKDSAEMFEPFRTTKPNGLGLGLVICRSIIESHGGRLSVSNNRGRGATVRFSLKAEGSGKLERAAATRTVAEDSKLHQSSIVDWRSLG